MDLAKEQQLVEQAKKDPESFAALYDYYFPKVYAFVLSKIQDREVSEDLVSEIFMKILKNLHAFEWRNVPFGAWIFRIARNRLNDYYREHGKKQTVDIEHVKESLHQDENLSPEKDAKRSELHDKVRELLKKIPEREADVVKLKFFSELSNGDIAKALQLSESNVGVIIFRTLKTLKPELQKYF